jgi:hypothetical protein
MVALCYAGLTARRRREELANGHRTPRRWSGPDLEEAAANAVRLVDLAYLETPPGIRWCLPSETWA